MAALLLATSSALTSGAGIAPEIDWSTRHGGPRLSTSLSTTRTGTWSGIKGQINTRHRTLQVPQPDNEEESVYGEDSDSDEEEEAPVVPCRAVT